MQLFLSLQKELSRSVFHNRFLNRFLFFMILWLLQDNVGGEEHLHNMFFLNSILTPFDDCFCVDSFCFLLNQFPLSISCNLILSVSLGSCKIQLFDLAYKLVDWSLRRMQNVGRIESDRTSNETDGVKNILNCNIDRFKLGILIIY